MDEFELNRKVERMLRYRNNDFKGLDETNSIMVGYYFIHPKTQKEIYISKKEKWKLFKMRFFLKWYKIISKL